MMFCSVKWMQARGSPLYMQLSRFHSKATEGKRRVMLHAQKTNYDYFVTCHPGLEDVVKTELESLDSGLFYDIRLGKAGVHFRGSEEAMYHANLWLRSAIRVLRRLEEVDLDSSKQAGDMIYEATMALPWPELISQNQTFSIESRIWGNSNFSNSQLVNVRVRDAICDSIRNARGDKPVPPDRVADFPLFITAFQDRLTIYLDSSGESLHKRGYSRKRHKASLNESAAAGCLLLAGWDAIVQEHGKQGEMAVLADPMCGGGTFLVEAALIAGNIAPGLYRRWWPFLSWPDADSRLWEHCVQKARSRRSQSKPMIELWGNDVYEGALELALNNAKAAGVSSLIKLRHGDCSTWSLPQVPDLVISNPPWNIRLQQDNIIETWTELGDFLKREAGGGEAFILSGSKDGSQGLRLKSSHKIPLTIGGVDCRLLQYKIHKKREV